MKKLLVLIILFLSWSEISFALSQQEAIKDYLSNRKLEKIEGVWMRSSGTVVAIYKSGSNFLVKTIRSATGFNYSGEQTGSFDQGSGNLYYGKGIMFQGGHGFFGDKFKRFNCNSTFVITASSTATEKCNGGASLGSVTDNLVRVWPENFNSHNAKFEKKDEKKKAKKKKARGASGTAFFITDKGHLLTNNHVIEVCNDNSKIVYNGKDIPAKVLAKDALLDLALLKVDLIRTKFIHLSDDPPKKLQRIIAAGYPLGKSLSDDLKFTSGIISSLKGLNDDSTLIQIDAALNKGNSGGPIIDEESGELVAIAVAGLDKSLTEAVNFGIKTNSVKNFLDANQLEVAVPSFFSFGIDAADILEKATVYTYCKND